MEEDEKSLYFILNREAEHMSFGSCKHDIDDAAIAIDAYEAVIKEFNTRVKEIKNLQQMEQESLFIGWLMGNGVCYLRSVKIYSYVHDWLEPDPMNSLKDE